MKVCCAHGLESGHQISDTTWCGGPPIELPIATRLRAVDINGRRFIPAESPRVLARITEEPHGLFLARCEGCEYHDSAERLDSVAREAYRHIHATGHAVLVEAL